MFANLTPIVKNILIINVALYALGLVGGIDLSYLFGVHYIFSEDFYIFQYLTYMWLHGSTMHLLGNMFGVFVFGPMLERVWGGKRFLTYYLITGIGAGLLFGIADTIEKDSLKSKSEVYSYNPNPDDFNIFIINSRVYNATVNFQGERVTLSELSDRFYDNPDNSSLRAKTVSIVREVYQAITNSNMIGASGALYGILIAFGMLFPNTELLLLFPPIPIKAKYLVFFYGAISLYSEINRSEGDNVAHLAHLGGMLIGFIVLKYWQKTTGRFY